MTDEGRRSRNRVIVDSLIRAERLRTTGVVLLTLIVVAVGCGVWAALTTTISVRALSGIISAINIQESEMGTLLKAEVALDGGHLVRINLPRSASCRIGQSVGINAERMLLGTQYRLGPRACLGNMSADHDIRTIRND